MSAPIGKTCGYADEHAELSSKILFQRFGQERMNLKRVTFGYQRLSKSYCFAAWSVEGFASRPCLLILTAPWFFRWKPQQPPCVVLVEWISQIERCPRDAPRCRRKYHPAPQLLNLALQYRAAATRCLPAKGCRCRT